MCCMGCNSLDPESHTLNECLNVLVVLTLKSHLSFFLSYSIIYIYKILHKFVFLYFVTANTVKGDYLDYSEFINL